MKKKDPLVGKYFHSVQADRETIEWQGQITARIGDSYLLQLVEWLTGSESNQTLVPVSEMNYWHIYDSVEEMGYHYEQYSRCQNAKEAHEAEVAATKC
jgi:hypothetical protein